MYLYSNILDVSTIYPFGVLDTHVNVLTDIQCTTRENSLLYAKLDVFMHAVIGNTAELNLANFEDLYSDIIKDNALAGLWFYPAAVGIHPSICPVVC